jgi:hypothetical protein
VEVHRIRRGIVSHFPGGTAVFVGKAYVATIYSLALYHWSITP